MFVPLSSLLPAYKLAAREEGELRVHFLDVGQGDCTVVEFPSGEVVVIDAGDGSFTNRNHTVRYLKALAPNKLTMILTHADADHYGGFEALIEAFGADTVYLPAYGEETPEYAALLKAVEKSGAKTDTMTRYDVVADGSGGVGVMLAGDISAAVERRLVRENALMEGLFDSGEYRVRLEETDTLKLSHHGSASSNTAEWLGLLSPEKAVVSCGKGNNYGHPAPEAISRAEAVGAEVFRTDELGDIILSVKGGEYRLSYTVRE